MTLFYFYYYFLWIIQLLIGIHTLNVTYLGIGTFTDTDFYDPNIRAFVLVPKSPEEIDPTFLFYTRMNRYEPDRINYNNITKVKVNHFNWKSKTKIIVHGFIDNLMLGEWMEKLKDNFLIAGDFNVIIVDWRKGNFFPYIQATANTRVVGPLIGILIKNLCKTFNISEESFHIVGHSLGAHIAGYAGKYLQGKLGHITGLDPAGPYFEGLKNTAARLWHTDAQFVESIHTDARHLIPDLGFGMYETCSHVDIYPNGGRDQPGCNQERVISVIMNGLVEGARRLVACNHQRSIDFYMEAILPTISIPIAYACDDYESFLEGKCSNCRNNSECIIFGPMGEENNKKNPSIFQGKRFFISTAPHEKFFKHQYLVIVKMASNYEKFISEEAIVKLRFIKFDGYGETLNFNRNYQVFNHSTDYAQIFVLDTDPEHVKEIEFKWSHKDSFLGIFETVSKMFVHVLEIVALSNKRSMVEPVRFRFVPEISGIINEKSVIFRKVQK